MFIDFLRHGLLSCGTQRRAFKRQFHICFYFDCMAIRKQSTHTINHGYRLQLLYNKIYRVSSNVLSDVAIVTSTSVKLVLNSKNTNLIAIIS